MTRRLLRAWAPAALLMVGAAFTVGIDRQRAMPLSVPLAQALPAELDGYVGTDMVVSDAELEVAGVSSYVMRSYAASAAPGIGAFTLYVGYYDQQTQGKTIHSPKNCLPGAGWDALQSEVVTIAGPHGPMTVNRYLLQREDQRALVLYWYQGRGRIEANEYVVKANLLRDSALYGRSEEALVRIVVPLTGDAEDAVRTGERIARSAASYVEHALPTI